MPGHCRRSRLRAGEIDGDEVAPWVEPLIALAAEIGSTVTFEPIASGADGFYRPSTKAIVVEASHPPNRQVKTLVHELAHALVRADRQDDDPNLAAAAEELLAETVIFWPPGGARRLGCWAQRR